VIIISKNKKELLSKIKNLADFGEGNESESAQQFLDRLLKKYEITEDELESSDETCIEFFKYSTELEYRILMQVIYKVIESKEIYKEKRRKALGAYCTIVQEIEIKENYDFYKKVIKDDFEIFFSAFCQKNKIFPEIKSEESSKSLSLEEILRIKSMMKGMSEESLIKSIEMKG